MISTVRSAGRDALERGGCGPRSKGYRGDVTSNCATSPVGITSRRTTAERHIERLQTRLVRELGTLILLGRLREGQVEDGAKLIRIERFCQQVSCAQRFCSEEHCEAGAALSRRDGEHLGIRGLV